MSVVRLALGWKNELVGWIVSMCSCKCMGSDHSGVRTTWDPSLCWNTEYWVLSRLSTVETGRVTLIQSFALLYCRSSFLTPFPHSQSWTWARVSSEGLMSSFTSAFDRCCPYRGWKGSETSGSVRIILQVGTPEASHVTIWIFVNITFVQMAFQLVEVSLLDAYLELYFVLRWGRPNSSPRPWHNMTVLNCIVCSALWRRSWDCNCTRQKCHQGITKAIWHHIEQLDIENLVSRTSRKSKAYIYQRDEVIRLLISTRFLHTIRNKRCPSMILSYALKLGRGL